MTHDGNALLDLERRRIAAVGAGDLAALDALLTDDHIHALQSGRPLSKADYIDLVRRSPRRPRRGELTIRYYGEAALMIGPLFNQLGADQATARTIPGVMTQVAVWRDGRWQFFSSAFTVLRDTVPKPPDLPPG